MAQLFEVQAFGMAEVGPDGRHQVAGSLMWEMPDEADEALEPILEPYGLFPFPLLNSVAPINGKIPWAVVMLPKEVPLATEIRAARGDMKDMYIGPYTEHPPGAPNPESIGIVVVLDKANLELLAPKSATLAAAWAALKNCSESTRWLVLLDDLVD